MVPLPVIVLPVLLVLPCVVDSVSFLGLPRPFKLPSPLGNSPKVLRTTSGLTGEAAVDWIGVATAVAGVEEEEVFSFKVNFNFLGGAAASCSAISRGCTKDRFAHIIISNLISLIEYHASLLITLHRRKQGILE